MMTTMTKVYKEHMAMESTVIFLQQTCLDEEDEGHRPALRINL